MTKPITNCHKGNKNTIFLTSEYVGCDAIKPPYCSPTDVYIQ
jgi:hypothetical protein